MFHINCSQCGHGHLVGSRSITSFENTDHGPVATAICPKGHIILTDFGRTEATPAQAPTAPTATPEAAPIRHKTAA